MSHDGSRVNPDNFGNLHYNLFQFGKNLTFSSRGAKLINPFSWITRVVDKAGDRSSDISAFVDKHFSNYETFNNITIYKYMGIQYIAGNEFYIL